MRRVIGWATIVGLLGVVGFPAAAQEEEGQEKEISRMEEVVVTAAKTETPMKEVTRAVSVIQSDDLYVEKGGFVSDALAELPETLVRRTGSIGRATSVAIRGANARQVHVAVDGAHVASPTLGSFDFNHFTPDNLERIEILRGAGSTLYGADAMGGVMNLVTRRGEGPIRFSGTAEYGTLLKTFREVLSMEGKTGNWALSGSVSRIDSRGLSENDAYQNVNLSTRIGYDFSEKSSIDFIFRHIWGLVGIDDGAFRPDPNRSSRERLTIGTLKWKAPVTERWSQEVRFSAQVGNLVSNDPSNGAGDSDSLFKLDTERYAFEWLHHWKPVDWNTVTFGFEIEDREADNRSFDKALLSRAFYLQNTWRPIDPLAVVVGGRAFRESAFGADEVWEASFAYFLERLGLKLRGGFSEGFRPPTLNELFFPGFGNENLAPERSRTYEAGFDQVLWDERVSWSATVFRSDYRELIQFISTDSGAAPQNVARARIDGVEVEAEVKPLPGWRLTASYAHLAHAERPSKEELLRVPNNTVSFTAGYKQGKKWDARLEGLVVSSREESFFSGRNKAKGYLRLNLYGSYRFNERLKAYLRVDNLNNRNYSEVLGFPAPGTVVNFGVTVER